MLNRRLTDENRADLTRLLKTATGFDRFDLFRACADEKDQVQVLSSLLTSAMNSATPYPAAPGTGSGTLEVNVTHECGSLILEQATVPSDDRDAALDLIERALSTAGAKIAYQVNISIILPEPK